MKKYNVIYADPPWNQKAGRKLADEHFKNIKSNVAESMAYNTMSVQDICSLNIQSIAEKDSFLFMWVTNKYLLQAEKVIKAWGFRYIACVVWKKKRMGGGLGGVVRITSEYLLFCRRGHLKAVGHIPESVIAAKRPYVNGKPKSSKKPDCFRELIESVSPPGNRLEMFARENHSGWDVFGDEVEGSIELN